MSWNIVYQSNPNNTSLGKLLMKQHISAQEFNFIWFPIVSFVLTDGPIHTTYLEIVRSLSRNFSMSLLTDSTLKRLAQNINITNYEGKFIAQYVL